MAERIRMTNSEEQMMQIFWSGGRPLTSVDIVAMKVKSTWGNGYVHNIIRSLVQKGLLKECGTERHKTQYARKLCPVMTKEEYIANQMASQVKGTKARCKMLIAFLRKKGDTIEDREEMITELEKMIQAFRESLEKEEKEREEENL